MIAPHAHPPFTKLVSPVCFSAAEWCRVRALHWRRSGLARHLRRHGRARVFHRRRSGLVCAICRGMWEGARVPSEEEERGLARHLQRHGRVHHRCRPGRAHVSHLRRQRTDRKHHKLDPLCKNVVKFWAKEPKTQEQPCTNIGHVPCRQARSNVSACCNVLDYCRETGNKVT